MKVDEYEKEAIQDMSVADINTSTFRDYVVSLGFKRIKWGRYLYNEECITTTLDEQLRAMYKEKFHYYTYEYDGEKIDKKNIDIYIHGDKEYRELERLYNKQKKKEKLVNQIMESIDKQSFTCNTILKHLLWESGSAV